MIEKEGVRAIANMIPHRRLLLGGRHKCCPGPAIRRHIRLMTHQAAPGAAIYGQWYPFRQDSLRSLRQAVGEFVALANFGRRITEQHKMSIVRGSLAYLQDKT